MNAKHIHPLPFIALLACVLFAFRQPDNRVQDQIRQKQPLSRVLNSNPDRLTDTGGRAVRIDSAQICISRFEEVMKKHGFSNVAGEKVNIHIKRTSMITTGEVFQGKGLLDWLNNTAAQYNAAGKTLMIKIQLGIYDSSYLNTYQSDAALRNKNVDRIAIFLIPYDSVQFVQQGIHANIAPPPPPPPGGTGYDLGGIQP